MSGDRGPLRTAIENWWKDWNPARRFGDYVSDRMLKFGKSMFEIEHALFDRYVTNPKLRTLFKEMFSEPPREGYEGGVVMYIVGSLLTGVLGIMNYGVPVQRLQRRVGNLNDPNEKLEFGRVVLLYLRKEITEQEFSDRCYEYGYNDSERNLFIRTTFQRLDPMVYLIRYRRGLDLFADYLANMREIGYEENEAEKLLEATDVIPGVQDLISMQVREAFNPELIRKFGYDFGDRSAVVEWARKQGLSEEWVDRYWYAHWVLPSVTMGIEMVHRLRDPESGLYFSENDLDLLMAANDIPEYFRKRILAVSAALLTRVDLRRLKQAGMIDEARVMKGYFDLGYPEEDAKALTEFALRGVSEDEKDLTLAQIREAYKDGLIDGGRASTELVKMGYDAEEAQLILASTDLDIAKAQLSEAIDYIRQRYQRGMIDEVAVRSELGVFAVVPQRIESYLWSWKQQMKAQPTLISQAVAARWLKKEIITMERYAQYLKALNYPDEDIMYWLTEAGLTGPAEGTIAEGGT